MSTGGFRPFISSLLFSHSALTLLVILFCMLMPVLSVFAGLRCECMVGFLVQRGERGCYKRWLREKGFPHPVHRSGGREAGSDCSLIVDQFGSKRWEAEGAVFASTAQKLLFVY